MQKTAKYLGAVGAASLDSKGSVVLSVGLVVCSPVIRHFVTPAAACACLDRDAVFSIPYPF